MMWVCFLALVCAAIHGVSSTVNLTGVNLSGAEFSSQDIPGALNYNYVWDGPNDAKYFVEKGMNVYRIPFLWERLQTVAGGPLIPAEIAYLHTLVNYLTNQSRYSLIDPHNFGAGFGGKIGQSSTAISLYADFWYKLALEFKNNSYVIFGLMNEPNNQNVSIWRDAAQTAINAIRFTGATNMITVPGVQWTGAWTWLEYNAAVMIDISDPIDNYIYEVHQYLDIDSSGTHVTCVNSTIGSERLMQFTAWARKNGKRGFLGEFGAGISETCGEALDDMLSYMDANDDVWTGWTYWSGGPWWGDWYFSNLTPNSTGDDRPQMQYVQPHIATSTPVPGKFPTPTGSYTPPQNFAEYLPVYSNGKLLSPFEDWSWAKHNLSYSGESYNSTYSISFDLSTYAALWFKCYGCLDSTKYFALEFYINPGTNGSLSHMGFSLMNGSAHEPTRTGIDMSAYASAPPQPNTWVKVSIPLGWFPETMHDGFQFEGNVNGPVGEMYLDQISLVAYVDPYSSIKVSSKPNPSETKSLIKISKQ